ncbi:MAG: MerR family transcriptional regulator [Lachnospiraceae bacterium]|nr:MerR family transcriptional regulator [Lachnospiraceae bacterium]
MKYKTSDLSKMLDVSANTIRRFAEKGYLSPDRNDQNQYRHFGDVDVEKITYISKYRKIGFGHEEIAAMLNADIFQTCEIYQKKMDELDLEIARLQSLRHMVKDDVNMMKGITEYGKDFIERNSVAMHYVSYKSGNQIVSSPGKQKVLHRFIYDFPEIEYIYIIRKEDILKRNIRYEEAIGIRSKLAQKKNIDVEDKDIECYPEQESVLRIVRLPIDFNDEKHEEKEIIQKILFDDFLEYMDEKGYILDGDAVGVKIGFSKEDGKEMQYVVLGMPIVKKYD